MNIDDAISHAMSVWFGDRAETITYNGVGISANVKYGTDTDPDTGSICEVMDLTVQVSDVPSHAYRDVAVVGSVTWYFWKQIEADTYAKTLRFRRNERPTFHR